MKTEDVVEWTEFVEYMSVFASTATLVALVLALYAFFFWRKQQMHSGKIEALLNMEDRFEILVKSYMDRHRWLLRWAAHAKEADSANRDKRKRVDDLIRQEFTETDWISKVNTFTFEYQLSWFRAKRLGLAVDVPELQQDSIERIFRSNLENHPAEDLDSGVSELANEVSVLKKSAAKTFETLRRSL